MEIASYQAAPARDAFASAHLPSRSPNGDRRSPLKRRVGGRAGDRVTHHPLKAAAATVASDRLATENTPLTPYDPSPRSPRTTISPIPPCRWSWIELSPI